MANKKKLLFRNFSFSMTLMLFFVGLSLVMYIHNGIISKLLKEQLSILVELDQALGSEEITKLKSKIGSNEGVISESIVYQDPESAIDQISKEFGQSMILSEMENPFQAMILFNISAEYFEEELLNALQKKIIKYQGVGAVYFQNEIFNQININISRIGLILAAISIIFLFISIIILNNLIQLNMLTKKDEIRTMLLVGARVHYVRAPLINRARKEALKSWVIAVFMLILIIFSTSHFLDIANLINIYYIFAVILILAFISLIVTMVSMFQILNKFFKDPYYDQKLVI